MSKCPTGKEYFATYKQANIVLSEQNKRKKKKGVTMTKAYKCPHCDGWHLTTARKVRSRK